MNFEEAEARFRELQARVQRGEPISRAEYEDQVQQLAVQDKNGVLWEINPRTGKWMYFDGAEWISAAPPGHDTSTVMPLSTVQPPSSVSSVPAAPTLSAHPPPPPPPPVAPPVPPSARPAPPPPPRPLAPSTRAPAGPSIPPPESIQPRISPEKPPAPLGGGQPSARAERGVMGGKNREWVPLAIGAVVLFVCAVMALIASQVVPRVLAASTPTKVALPTIVNTPIPTVVRLPTQPPPTPTPVPVLAKVIERAVNVRAAPSRTGRIISSLKKDNQVTLIARSDDGQWYQINIAGGSQPGWVFAETLDIVSGEAKALPVAGPATPAPTATKGAAPPQVTPTPTTIGEIPVPKP